MTEFTTGIQGAFNSLLKKSSLTLALIYTVGHVIIAMTVISVMTGASLWEAVLVALVEPTINGFWYYLLDKFCGNLTIEEYRTLMEQDKLILVMDKPLSRNYPELFEENNEYHVHTINTFSKKKKDMVKQNIFHVS